jgi:hypothetical protein
MARHLPSPTIANIENLSAYIGGQFLRGTIKLSELDFERFLPGI